MTQVMIFTLVVLVILSSFFSGTETAFIALNSLKLRHLVDKNKENRNALLVKKLKDDSHRLISTLLIGNNLVNIAASAIATSLSISFFGSKGVGIATGVMTLVVLVFGEITPKTIAMANSEKICLFAAKPIYWMSIVFLPLIKVLDILTKNMSRCFNPKTAEEPIVTEEEIKSFVKIGEEIGSIEKDEKEMIHNIFRLNDIKARDFMTPKIHVMAYEENKTVADIKEQIIGSRFSRIPIYKKTIDKVTGILYVKDVVKAIAYGKLDSHVKDIARPAFFIPETKVADSLLRDFQKKNIHIAVVVDEYGIVSGIVTIEDLLEEIVGEIYDETDIVKENISRTGEHQFDIDGDATLQEIHKKAGILIRNTKEINTISGYIMDKTGKIPRPGDIIRFKEFNITILSMIGQRIAKVRLTTRQ
ncbi:HlyC/CorC family transporter [Candidatus Woesearchaeota archaeon]|nr:HlyC/CorC family transporter [Candidatus Woesearchaeota archaeon]